MKTIQMTIDESLLEQVDQVSLALKTTRSSFIRSALRMALRRHSIEMLERQHEQGYANFPPQPGEFDGWETEQIWEKP
ncbi:MAG: ribbon-helix-helix protein, CopG family [Candidatus Omnitrophota bacterium]|jgi:metal-responsive CopG/Arc/MetJ family transcriptional regulator|nr:MAG: ribbon-helix-helix protein, CopG family [Candidatus Omnitrophota bacterium]